MTGLVNSFDLNIFQPSSVLRTHLCQSTEDQDIIRHICIDIWRRSIFLIFRAVRRFVHVLFVKLHQTHVH
jgi:hypothetical protein